MNGGHFIAAARGLAAGATLGGGSGGEVVEASDPLLRRTVALKALHPRRLDEGAESYRARVDAFRREAALTAALEHPGIVPVHDLGELEGRPAFAMKPLRGRSLGELIAAGGCDTVRASDVALRVAEAVGFAHVRGFVHRDLKPEHVWIGDHGEVTVIDWGLAAAVGRDARCVGTAGWMSPEQEAAAAADPRMDVWAIGGLIEAMLGSAAPRGLAAVAVRCRARDPALRYPDGGAVAEDLRRWIADGISQAQRPGPAERLVAAVRRSPGLAAAAAFALAAAALAACLPLLSASERRAAALAELRGIAHEPLGDVRQVEALRRRVQPIASAHPGLPEARLVEARLEGAQRQFEDAARLRLLADALDALERSWRVRGPWPEEVAQLQAVLDAAGARGDEPGVCHLESHPEAARLHRGMLQLQRARQDGGLQPDAGITAVLAACHDRAWAAASRVVVAGAGGAAGADLELALASPDASDAVLAACLPDPRLVAAAARRLADDPGAFWPRVCLAQDALRRTAWAEARAHALVALGRESSSLWPRLALGHAAMAEADWGAMLVEATHAAAANPGYGEARLMQAVALARLGRRGEAGECLARIRPGALPAASEGPPVSLLQAAARDAGLGIQP